jgi:hypothetical protein
MAPILSFDSCGSIYDTSMALRNLVGKLTTSSVSSGEI